MTYITTSWDDGHPLDLRIAELLTKYRLPGTFYPPMTAENATMSAVQIRDLSRAFEIGAHTLHHVVLTSATEQQVWQEIAGAKSWIEDNTGQRCLMFCPPKGKYSGRHLTMVSKAGYLGLRSTELLSLDFPRLRAGITVLPTTIQAYPHNLLAVGRNAIKRGAFDNLWRYIAHGGSVDWPALAQSLLRRALKRGGVFHLWGHSWELQETGQWQRLDEALRFVREFASHAPSLTNGQLCCQSQRASADKIQEDDTT
jgi:peptidoglycan-N-acetylglucosamine deacetylase